MVLARDFFLTNTPRPGKYNRVHTVLVTVQLVLYIFTYCSVPGPCPTQRLKVPINATVQSTNPGSRPARFHTKKNKKKTGFWHHCLTGSCSFALICVARLFLLAREDCSHNRDAGPRGCPPTTNHGCVEQPQHTPLGRSCR